MTRILTLLAAALLLPAIASAYGGDYGVHCSTAMKKAGKCEKNAGIKVGAAAFKGRSTIGPEEGPAGSGAAGGGAKGTATSMNPAGGAGQPPGLPPGFDPAAAAAAASGLKDSAPVNGKCPDGSTPVPGLNGTTRCIPGNLTGH